jgi:aspartyl-tRNA(Asn)/glutamyl-tRNA(Gln) amidotransferase subunit A
MSNAFQPIDSIEQVVSSIYSGANVVASAQQALINNSAHTDLHCFISLEHDRVLAQAKALDASALNERGSLHGVPVGIKDVLLVKGERATAGSKMLENFIAPYDATVIEKLVASGAVLFGKTNMDEFAMGSSNENSYFGKVLNPWDKARVPGGSSGGSAAAVAARIVPVALGSDTGGSIRQPASYCGIVGIKPTYGRVSRYGVIAFASSLDQIGVFATNVADAAKVLEVISGHDPKDATSEIRQDATFMPQNGLSLKGLRIGLPAEYFIDGIDKEVREVIDAALVKYQDLGAVLVPVSLPHTASAVPTYYIIAPAEASSNLSRYDGIRYGHRAKNAQSLSELIERTRSEGFGKEVKRRILLGTYVLSHGYYDAYYRKAQAVRACIAQDFAKAFQGHCDIIACPTAPTTAFRFGENQDDPVKMYLNDIFTIPASLAGLPALSIPCGFDSKGLPVGLQLIGSAWNEKSIVQAAHSYQEHSDWHRRFPDCAKAKREK